MIDRQYIVKGQLAYLNEHDEANRANKFGGAKLKKIMTDMVVIQLKNREKVQKPCKIAFIWHFSTAHDFDNIRFAAKYVLDGMQKAGVLPNDNQKWVTGFLGDSFVKCKKGAERVIIEVTYD